jgi:hypothetical protein
VARVASALAALTLVVLAAVAAGCAGDDEPLVAESELPRLVLQPGDLEQDWVRFDEGRQLRADAPPGVRSDPARFDRQGGWKARYRRPGSPATDGPLVVESRADLFADVSGAERDFDAAVDDLERAALASQPVETVELGDEARLLRTGGSEPGQLAVVTIVWRDQNLVAAVTANGFTGRLAPSHVTALAEKQQRRIESAVE